MLTLQLIFNAVIVGVVTGGLYALLGMGLTLIYGTMDVINFAHGSFMMLGMYTTFWLFKIVGIDPFLSLFISIPLFFLIGFLLYGTFLRRVIGGASRLSQMLITFGLFLVLNNAAASFWTYDIRFLLTDYSYSTFNILGVPFFRTQIYAFIIALVGSGVLYVFLERTYVGLAIRATAQNKEAATILGINIHRMYGYVLGMGIALAALAGGLLATFYPIQPYVGDSFAIVAFVVSVVGGLGDYRGAFIGGLAIGVTEAVFAVAVNPMFKQVAYLLFFILIVLVKPQGLFSKREKRGIGW